MSARRRRKGHALRRRYGHSTKTFGRVPVGGLFQMKDDPDNATLQKVGKATYVVVAPYQSSIKHVIAPSYPIKRGRQR